MKFGRYLVVLVWSWLLGAAAVVGFTVLVDPIGISPVRIAIAGFNTLKPLQQDYDWIVKRYDVGRNQPTTVFMGSSRIKQSVDPKLFAGTAFAPAYNGGLNGSANLAETRAYLETTSRQTRICIMSSSRHSRRRYWISAHRAVRFVAPTENTSRPIVLEFGIVRYSGHGVGILLHERSELCYSHCCCQSRTGQRAHSRLI